MKAREVGVGLKLEGRRATRLLDLPLFVGEGTESVQVKLRCMGAGEAATVLEKARSFAVEKGVKEPKEGEELYDYAKAIHTVLVSVLDPDDDAPFFASVEEILGHRVIGRDQIIYLAEAQILFEDLCNPQISKVSDEEVGVAIASLAGEEESKSAAFFSKLRPGTQFHLARSMAALCVTLLDSRSPSGGSSSDEATSEKPESEKRPSKEPKRAARKGKP